MNVRLFILGFLRRYGPIHGYGLQKLFRQTPGGLSEINTPLIYYHLDKLQKKGMLAVEKGREANRPEKSVYTITATGIDYLKKTLQKTIAENTEFPSAKSAALLFSDMLNSRFLINVLTKSLMELLAKKRTSPAEGSGRNSPAGNDNNILHLISRHREYHMEAEIRWLKEAIARLRVSGPEI